MKVSFSGIYDIRFPAGTSRETIMNKYNQADEYIKTKYTKDDLSIVNVRFMDRFDCQKTKEPLAKEGVRISSAIDNPDILCDIFDSLDKDLGQQYVNKSKVELVLDA